MATYATRAMTDPLNNEPEQRCDPHSHFDSEGFPLPAGDDRARSWTPVWGGPCVVCAVPC